MEKPPAAVATPTQAARRLNELHIQRAYAPLSSLIIRELRGQTIETLRAIDDVIDATRRLTTCAASRYGVPPSESWGLGDMENNLGLFSRNVKVINESYYGEGAIVTLQEAAYVPLVRAKFVLRDGAWQFIPEPTPRAILPELRSLTRLIDDMIARAEGGMEFQPFLDAYLAEVPAQLLRTLAVKHDPAELAMETESGGAP